MASRPGEGYIDPNFPNPVGEGDARIIIYGYTPNFALCILGIVLFALAFLVHSVQVLRYRVWSFIPLAIACIMEVVGYAFRSLSSRKDPYRVTFFVVQYFLIVTAPVLISASIYVCLTKIIAWAEQEGLDLERSPFLRKKRILWTFITIDVLSTIMQVTGAAMIGSAESNRKDPTTANNILLAGLAIQTFAFLVFLLLLSVVISKIEGDGTMKEKLKRTKSPLLIVLVLASLLVFIRTIFRLAETAQGVFGNLSSHEAYFGGLEFAPVIVAVGLLAVWFPGRWPTQIEGRSKTEGAHEFSERS